MTRRASAPTAAHPLCPERLRQSRGKRKRRISEQKSMSSTTRPTQRPSSTKTTFSRTRLWRYSLYLGILVLVPLFAARESRYARFHTNQGLVLAIAQFAWTFVSRIIVSAVGAVNETVSLIIGGVCSLVNIAFAVLTVIGIINAAKGTAKELPVIGKITILK